jgi:hypothetical protein
MKDEIEESNRHLREAWQLYARVSPHGEAFDRDGWSVANACQPWFFMNVGVLRGPVVDARDLQRRAQQTTTYFAARSNPWVLTASENWFGENATSVLADIGLAYKLDLMGRQRNASVPRPGLCPIFGFGVSMTKRAGSLLPTSKRGFL